VATLAEQAVDGMNKTYGRHEGARAVHAKGVLCKGSFTATPEAARLTTAAHMQGQPVDVTVRFSNGSGNPASKDDARDARGMATKFYLPDGSRTDIVALTLPCFFVRTPEEFVTFQRASISALDRALKLPAFLLTHPGALRALRAYSTAKQPASYASLRYHALHAFRWIDADGAGRFIRYRWLPEGGEQSVSAKEAKSRGHDYLQEELADRLGRQPARFTLELQLAGEGDRTDDPTKPWPDERETVNVGTLELTALETGRETGGDVLVFDPTRVTDGIELSDDQILRFRSHAYSVSIERRSGAARPAELA
jgi:catalase